MKTILLVEDDGLIATHLVNLLNSDGYKVIHVSSQQEAQAVLQKDSFDLALVDIALPDGNGFSVLTDIHSQTNIPVIFLTASGDESSVVTGLHLGAADYIIKPFRPRELLARISAALRKDRTCTRFNVGTLLIDTANGTVHKNGEEIFLTALEYRLLLIFVNHPSQILTRSQLLNALWDAAGEFVNDNTLTVYIKRLREKIEDDPSSPQYIVTVRGLGYRLGENNVSQ